MNSRPSDRAASTARSREDAYNGVSRDWHSGTDDPDMLHISRNIGIPDEEMEITAIRAGGPGGQHVNKAATAIHLRFDIHASSLPEHYKQRLLELQDQRITGDGVVVIKAREHRSRDLNEQSARERLRELVRSAGETPKPRRPTRPSRGAREKRIEEKKQRGKIKGLRKPPPE